MQTKSASGATLNCPLCNQRAFERLMLPHTRIWKCANPSCGLRFAFPQLDEESLREAYAQLYYPKAEGTQVGTLRKHSAGNFEAGIPEARR